MISTKNIDNTESENKGFTKPVISPGNHLLKINKVFLKPETKAEFGIKVILGVETKPVEDPNFKGFSIDVPNGERGILGTHKGQIGNVAYSRWGFKDFLTNTGIQILQEEEILKAIKTICENLAISQWFEDADSRFPTIEDFVIGFNNEAPFKDIWATYCIAGRQYLSKDSKHINHELFLPNPDRLLGKAFHIKGDKVQKFFETNHIEELKSKTEGKGVVAAIPNHITNPPKTTFVDKTVAASTESNEDWLASINAPVEQIHGKDLQTNVNEPVKITPSSQAEVNFLNAGPNTQALFGNTENKKEESTTDIARGSSENPHMPWDQPQYDEWEKANK